jgi:hypothetical protein
METMHPDRPDTVPETAQPTGPAFHPDERAAAQITACDCGCGLSAGECVPAADSALIGVPTLGDAR